MKLKSRNICNEVPLIVDEEESKPYLEFFSEFIIKKLKLQINYYTENDYFYWRSGKDFEIAYNPRCQLLDLTPKNKHAIFHGSMFPRECEKALKQAKTFWEEACLEFFLKYGKHPNQYVVARLYGVKGINFPYITYLTENDFSEWDEVRNWKEIGKKYKKNKYFKYAYFGENFPPKSKKPSKIKTPRSKRKITNIFLEPIKQPEFESNDEE